jgi:hypothetical protein
VSYHIIIQYRGLRLALRLMCSSPNNSLGVLSGIPGIPPLPERFVYLTSKYLVAVFYITPSESFTRHELSALLGTPLVDVYMENAIARVQDTMYPPVAPRELSVVTSEYVESAAFYTDGSLIEGNARFAIHQTGVGGFGFKLSSPAGVFSAELSALFMALQHIREVIHPLEKMLDSNR